MTSTELRKKFLDFFREKNHAVIPSASLVPANDPTVLFTTAGMHPLVPYLLGEKHPAGNRLVSVQKCIRTGDIDEVGDDTHLTFFEMLGNWSLGDYFKEDAVKWSWEFLTDKKWLGIDPIKLAFSCFAGDADAPRDDESAKLWMSRGVLKEHIAFLGKEDNWWGPAGITGPCGPDTEMFYWTDDNEEPPANFQETHKDPRWVEIWNDVFMEYNKTANGKYEPLKQKNVDTGMGLERTLAALNGKKSTYETDLFTPILSAIRKKVIHHSENEEKKSRIIADHIRAAVFIIGDGVEPSNKDRGYVLRRLLRRTILYADILGIAEGEIAKLGDTISNQYSHTYEDLLRQKDIISYEINKEESRFRFGLKNGLHKLKSLDKVREKLRQSTKEKEDDIKKHPYAVRMRDDFGSHHTDSINEISGKDVFDLYQNYGFPPELVNEELAEYGMTWNKAEFGGELKKHQELSRTSSAGVFKGGLADHSEKVVRLHTATHLMNKALRDVLGEHVWQRGSHINAERTRFDFTHPEKMMPEQIQKVEGLVNGWIARDLAVKKEIMPLEEARKLNAVGAFGEKYGETVSVYTVCDPKTNEVISREFCGGPHVERTGVIGKFKVIKEEAIAAGIRRIKAVVG